MTAPDRPRFRLITRAPVTAVLEHKRIISGTKAITGESILREINLGWFIHFVLGDEEFSVEVGTDKPPVEKGDTLRVTWERE